jgi:hypothetical protein
MWYATIIANQVEEVSLKHMLIILRQTSKIKLLSTGIIACFQLGANNRERRLNRK